MVKEMPLLIRDFAICSFYSKVSELSERRTSLSLLLFSFLDLLILTKPVRMLWGMHPLPIQAKGRQLARKPEVPLLTSKYLTLKGARGNTHL